MATGQERPPATGIHPMCRFIQVWDETSGRIAYDAATVRDAVEEAVSEALYYGLLMSADRGMRRPSLRQC